MRYARRTASTFDHRTVNPFRKSQIGTHAFRRRSCIPAMGMSRVRHVFCRVGALPAAFNAAGPSRNAARPNCVRRIFDALRTKRLQSPALSIRLRFMDELVMAVRSGAPTRCASGCASLYRRLARYLSVHPAARIAARHDAAGTDGALARRDARGSREKVLVAETYAQGWSEWRASARPTTAASAMTANFTRFTYPGFLGYGAGSMLISGFRGLHGAGYSSCVIWAHARNPARFFYEAMGGRLVAERSRRMLGPSCRSGFRLAQLANWRQSRDVRRIRSAITERFAALESPQAPPCRFHRRPDCDRSRHGERAGRKFLGHEFGRPAFGTCAARAQRRAQSSSPGLWASTSTASPPPSRTSAAIVFHGARYSASRKRIAGAAPSPPICFHVSRVRSAVEHSTRPAR